ncbi:phosphodiester glycosidase family protein [Streptomyces roseoviridis]|uniref:Phosphodiester glycosidase family protein n=1 Tax=Streptomyces roseoviridis TaxID=67361 RepID=A0ABV5QXT1_9ACTN
MTTRASGRPSRPRRRSVAAALALSAGLLVASPGATSATGATGATGAAGATAPEPSLLDAWTESGRYTLAAGVTYVRYTERAVTEGRVAKRELNVVVADPALGATRLESTVGGAAARAETVGAQLAAVRPERPLAGINGSFFAPEPPHEGGIAFGGTAVRDGQVNGTGCLNGNQAVVLQHGLPYISKLRATVTLQAVDASGAVVAERLLDDVNRDPGRGVGCVRGADDVRKDLAYDPSAPDDKTTVFVDGDELVAFNDSYNLPTPSSGRDTHPEVTTDDDPGYEVTVDPQGVFTLPKDAGGQWTEGRGGKNVATGGFVLQAVGAEAERWLRDNLTAGRTLQLRQEVVDLEFPDHHIALDESVDIVSGLAHRLLDDGATATTSDTCARLFDRTGVRRKGEPQPGDHCRDSRTALGVDTRGRTVMATLTGRRDVLDAQGGVLHPTDTADTAGVDGAFLHEFAAILKLPELGVIDAVNLDGGGSTTLYTLDKRQTGMTDIARQPDGTYRRVERPVADGVYLTRGGYALPGGTLP